MNDIEQAIEQSFRGMVQGKRYRSISVKDICEQACVSRKTFYAYFDGKDAIVDRIFCRDVVNPTRELTRMLSNDEALSLARALFERVFTAVENDGEYYRALVVPMRGVDLTFNTLATKAFCDYYLRALERLRVSPDKPGSKYIAFYFASSLADLIEKWICDAYPVSPAEMAKVYEDVALPYWKNLAGGGRSRL